MAMVAMVLTAFFWAAIEILGGLIPKGYSPVQTVWSRYLVHILFMLVVFGPRRRTALVRTTCIGMQVSRALLMLGMPLCFILGVTLLPLKVVWAVSWISSLVVLFLAAVALGERISPELWIVSGLGWIGVWLMLGAIPPPIDWRLIPPLGMGLCYAVYVIMTRTMRTESSCANLFHTALWVLLPLSLLIPFQWKMPTPRLLAVYAGIGILGYLCLYFLDKSMELAPAALSMPLIYTVPIWSSVLDYLVYGELPMKVTILGAMIVLGVISYVVWVESTGKRPLVTVGQP